MKTHNHHQSHLPQPSSALYSPPGQRTALLIWTLVGTGSLFPIACAPDRTCPEGFNLVEGGGISGKRHGDCQTMPIDTDSDSTTTMGETTTTDTTLTTTEVTTTTITTEPTTSTTTEDPTTTTGDPPCNYDLICDPEEDIAGCLHDCATCDDNGRCDPASETPYSCPGDCPATNCNHDGVIDALSEQCDDGELNLDTAKCKDDCSLNICGDGALHEGVEECDDGNLIDGDGCSSTCTIEERLIFITSKKYKGDLKGLTGADSECKALGDAKLPGSYQAWLSDSNASAAQRLQLQDFSGDFLLTDKTLIAKGWDGLTSGNLENPINLDEDNNLRSDESVWTNTQPNGESVGPENESCKDWSHGTFSMMIKGHHGVSSSQEGEQEPSWWTDAGTANCSSDYHLYCIQTTP